MASKVKAWDSFHSDLAHILQIGWSVKTDSLNREHVVNAVETLYGANLTIDQINALTDAIYWSYQYGKEMAIS